jgi:hypothetical protein
MGTIRATADLAAADLAVADPAVADPAVADLAAADLAVADPAVADPAVADTKVADPKVADPAESIGAFTGFSGVAKVDGIGDATCSDSVYTTEHAETVEANKQTAPVLVKRA